MSLIRDRHGRRFDYLRVAVTERCNLRCVYCMPEEGVDFKGGEQLLRCDELLRVIATVARLGVRKVRFTGGEPLVRRDMGELVAGTVATEGIESVQLTTNGVLFAQHARRLREAGLGGVNISLDTLEPRRFATLTRRTGVEQVLQAMRLALELGFPAVKINVVAMRGFNDDELPAFVELTRELPITVRFIELMPFDADQIWKRGRFLGVHKIIEALRGAFAELEPASGSQTEQQVLRLPGGAGRVAVIPAYTRSLCGDCNRIRLTADGKIRNCLFSEREFDLLQRLRQGASDEQIGALFVEAMSQKKIDGWAAQREAREQDADERHRTSMTQIGG